MMITSTAQARQIIEDCKNKCLSKEEHELVKAAMKYLATSWAKRD